MTVGEMIKQLSKFDPSLEITILDGFNGGGIPRTINLGPFKFNGKAQFEGDEQADYSDIETELGKPIIIMGYGCY